jgi:hypothetical protein
VAAEQRPINYYAILNVDPHATHEEIHAVYRARIAEYHPDRNRSTHATAIAALLNEAWEVLGDLERRRAYDEKAKFAAPGQGASPASPPPPPPPRSAAPPPPPPRHSASQTSSRPHGTCERCGQTNAFVRSSTGVETCWRCGFRSQTGSASEKTAASTTQPDPPSRINSLIAFTAVACGILALVAFRIGWTVIGIGLLGGVIDVLRRAGSPLAVLVSRKVTVSVVIVAAATTVIGTLVWYEVVRPTPQPRPTTTMVTTPSPPPPPPKAPETANTSATARVELPKEPPVVPEDAKGDAVQFMRMIIEGMSGYSQAEDAIGAGQAVSLESVPAMVNQMAALRTADHQFRFAASIIEPFSKSHDQLVADLAPRLAQIYRRMASLYARQVQVLETLWKNPAGNQAELAIELSKIRSDAEGVIQAIALALAGTTYTLIDYEHTDDPAKTTYLRITRMEKNELERRFHDIARPVLDHTTADPTGESLRAAAIPMWNWFRKPWRCSDDPSPRHSAR